MVPNLGQATAVGRGFTSANIPLPLHLRLLFLPLGGAPEGSGMKPGPHPPGFKRLLFLNGSLVVSLAVRNTIVVFVEVIASLPPNFSFKS